MSPRVTFNTGPAKNPRIMPRGPSRRKIPQPRFPLSETKTRRLNVCFTRDVFIPGEIIIIILLLLSRETDFYRTRFRPKWRLQGSGGTYDYLKQSHYVWHAYCCNNNLSRYIFRIFFFTLLVSLCSISFPPPPPTTTLLPDILTSDSRVSDPVRKNFRVRTDALSCCIRIDGCE